jgi:pantoate--beta-alanine ligase
MYPADFSTYVEVEDFGKQLTILHRSTYFRGMTTSVLKMINIVKPAFIFFGQKDGLQGAILRKMIRDLNINTEVVVTPVVRDQSGLAYAARNYFMTPAQLASAAVIHRALQAAERAVAEGENQTRKIQREIAAVMETVPDAQLEYAVIADPETLEPVTKLQGEALLALGAKIGNTSLNDSVLLKPAK